MDEFEKKYGYEEDEKTVTFHKSRRMFCIYENKLHIAKPNLPYSHAVWFEKEGWMTREKDNLMDSLVRGIIDAKGDVYFYTGYDFNITSQTESVFFPYLEELVTQLSLSPEAKVFGGLIKQQEAGKIWPPRKEYGSIRDNR